MTKRLRPTKPGRRVSGPADAAWGEGPASLRRDTDRRHWSRWMGSWASATRVPSVGEWSRARFRTLNHFRWQRQTRSKGLSCPVSCHKERRRLPGRPTSLLPPLPTFASFAPSRETRPLSSREAAAIAKPIQTGSSPPSRGWRAKGHLLYPDDESSHGLMTSTSGKSAPFRVATANPWTIAVAAIMLSRVGRTRPFARCLSTYRAHSEASGIPNPSILPASAAWIS